MFCLIKLIGGFLIGNDTYVGKSIGETMVCYGSLILVHGAGCQALYCYTSGAFKAFFGHSKQKTSIEKQI